MFVQDLAERLAHISVRLKEKQVPCPLNRCKAHGLNPSRPAVVKGTPRGASSQSRLLLAGRRINNLDDSLPLPEAFVLQLGDQEPRPVTCPEHLLWVKLCSGYLKWYCVIPATSIVDRHLLLPLFPRLNKNQGASKLCDLNKVTSCLQWS